MRRAIDGITQTMPTKQLRALEADGLVARKAYAEVPPRVEYAATPVAKDLDGFFMAMHECGGRNLSARDAVIKVARPRSVRAPFDRLEA